MLRGGVVALRNFGAFICDVAVKYRGLLGYSEEFVRTENSCVGTVALGCFVAVSEISNTERLPGWKHLKAKIRKAARLETLRT
nr:MAG TPA: hypothetical protein [Caudoviricetes sp.]